MLIHLVIGKGVPDVFRILPVLQGDNPEPFPTPSQQGTPALD